MMRIKTNCVVVVTLSILLLMSACSSSGIPITLRIDEFTMDLDVDELLSGSIDELRSVGLIGPETAFLPELWPDSLPDVTYRVLLSTDPVDVDLTPEPGSEDEDKYDDISKAEGVVTRIELNRLVLRVETSSISVALPELRVQVAREKDADPQDRLAWRTIGGVSGAEPGFVGDIEFHFLPGGESFLNSQFADEEKELALRVQSLIELDTEKNPRLPSGKATVRLIVEATFFIDPAGAIDSI